MIESMVKPASLVECVPSFKLKGDGLPELGKEGKQERPFVQPGPVGFQAASLSPKAIALIPGNIKGAICICVSCR